ncbi:MAG: formylglycine-generating enzyme family protein, partial [Treponema sp.]|nr:formylglycine-generating enzyme family protein [Treponema sp.]
MGIVSFGPDAKNLTEGPPVFLDAKGLETLTGILDKQYQRWPRQGTAMYYGVHKALSALSDHAEQFPDNLDSVNVVTFTDGLDNGSTGLGLGVLENQDFRGAEEEAYQEYLRVQLRNRPVAGLPVTAFSAGVRGSDVTDGKKFTAALQAVASHPGNFYELTNFSQLNEKFGKIADELTTVTTNTTFRLVTPGYPRGTKIRMTFDGASRAEGSGRYLEGTVGIDPGTRSYVLMDVVYQGVSSSAGRQVAGVLDAQEVGYVFEDFKGYERGQGVKQWSMSPRGGVWQVNSEYTLGESVTTRTEYKSAVVYLALDGSTSLGVGEVQAIRDAAKGFIKTLYEKSRGPGAEPIRTGTMTISAASAGTMSISGNGMSQEVSITAGGQYRGSFAAGSYTVSIRYGDGKSESRSITVQGDQSVQAAFSYQGAPPARAAPANFVRVEGGTFQMGSTHRTYLLGEHPVHTVTVGSFYMGKYEVTQKEWMEVMGTSVRQQRDMANKSWELVGEGDSYPMYYVSWHEAVEYCNRRSVKEGLTPAYTGSGDSIRCNFRANGYRLPTEAEWEYAAKGG